MKKFIFTLMFVSLMGCNDDAFNSHTQPTDETIDEGILAIQELMTDAISGSNHDVQYIITGDSTRDNYHNDMIDYYSKQLAKANISVIDNAESGQSALGWMSNSSEATLEHAVSATTGDGSNTILEYSFGINDFKNNVERDEVKNRISQGIKLYLEEKPNTHILLVSPVLTNNSERNVELSNIYKEVSSELSLPLISGEIPTRGINLNSDFYYDATHPNKNGSRRIVNHIFSELGNAVIHDIITLNEIVDDSNLPPHDANLSNGLEPGYWNNKTGAPIHHDDWKRFSSIDILPNHNLKISHVGDRKDVVFTDIDDNFLVSTPSLRSPNGEFRTVHIPDDAYHAKITITSNPDDYATLEDLPLEDLPTVFYHEESQKILNIEDTNKGLNIRLRIE